MTSSEILAYLAGILDGEGCIGLYNSRSRTDTRSTHFQLVVRVTQKSPQAVELLNQVFGGNMHTYTDVGPNKPGPYFSWRVTNNQAVGVLEKLQPYLREKRAQCDLALEFQARRREHKRGTRLTAEELEIRLQYVDKLKQFKHVKWPLTYFTATQGEQ